MYIVLEEKDKIVQLTEDDLEELTKEEWIFYINFDLYIETVLNNWDKIWDRMIIK